MKPETGKTVQAILLVLLVLAAVRLGLIWYGRHSAATEATRERQQSEAERNQLNADYYVTSRKLHLYDVKSARQQLTQQAVWVREGYHYTYFPYNPATHTVNFRQDAGQLGPLQKLDIRDVIRTPPPERGQPAQIVAIFAQNEKQYGFPIGMIQGDDTTIYADDMLFYQDPRELYKHWGPGVWQAIDQHQARPGMSELQAAFALGMGMPQGTGDGSEKTVVYPNGGKQVTITFRNGKAADIRQSG